MKVKATSPSLNTFKSALWTSLWTFLGTVGILATGWLQQVATWTQTNGHTPLPGISTIGYAVIGAAVGAGGGLVAFVVRYAEDLGVLPGNPPQFTPAAAVELAPPLDPTEADPLLVELTKVRDRYNAAIAIVTGSPLPAPTVLGGVVTPPLPPPI